MKKEITVKIIDGKMVFPTIPEIIEFQKQYEVVLLKFEDRDLKEKHWKQLVPKLPDYHVFNRRWDGDLWIGSPFPTPKIEEILPNLFECAVTFREEGIFLMKKMGERYGFDLFKKEELYDFIRETRATDPPRRGAVDEEWNYYFHGAECEFENQKTGQIVELVITYCPEFGALDSYFFYNYIKTTPRFKDLANFFEGEHKTVAKGLDLLELGGFLEIIDPYSNRGKIALKRD